ALIWITGCVYTGLLIYKTYVRSQEKPAVAQQESHTSQQQALYSPVTTQKQWNKKADQIRRDHRNLVKSYKQRQRDHQRITRNLMRSNKF
ncbi:MAG: hypothetical protein K8I00_08195, partial [Candidatus Omnitrophica bacterium]|nr:hypothetical protein [Candidatus Omnitrophota bacterium]